MKNVKDGFTLVEMLAVIVILGLIAIITIPTIVNQIKENKEELYNTQIKLIESGAISYVTDQIAHPSSNSEVWDVVSNKKSGSIVTVSLKTLQETGAVDYNISNPLCDGNDIYFDPNDVKVKMTYDGKEFAYEVVSESNKLRESCTSKV